ncbi:VOC family protein [Paenibacillus algorifonticola]|uniref:VOC family protein n=1 Tax=Paenibacillus algorifonticola TaxID=684063 RepID=UPI003D2865FE
MIVYSEWIPPAPNLAEPAESPISLLIPSIVVPVQDVERATKWYARLLGQAISSERQDGGPVYWFDLEKGPGILLDDNRSHPDWDRFPTFMLRASNIQAAYPFMQGKQARILQGIEQEHHFFAADPEGNAMIVCL